MNLFLNSYHPLGNNRLDQNFTTEGLAPAVGLRQEQLHASQPAWDAGPVQSETDLKEQIFPDGVKQKS